MSSVVFISFHCLSCCIHFLLCSFHFAFIPFHVAFISFRFAVMSFHVPVRRVSAQTLTFLSYFVIVFVIVWLSFWRPVQVAISGFMNMYIYKLLIGSFFSYGFLGRQRIGSVKVQAKRKCNARGDYTMPHDFRRIWCHGTYRTSEHVLQHSPSGRAP